MKEFLLSHADVFSVGVGFFIIAIGANQIAKSFQKIKLPLITGLICTGIVAGPHLSGLVSHSAKESLQFINEIALAFIAFAAGAELYLSELHSRFNSIKWNTFGQLVVTFVVGSIAIYFLAAYIPYMADLAKPAQIAISMITAALFVARSPASAIAVINELRAKGPFVQTVIGVTVVKDFLVIILFSICLSLGQTMINGVDFSFIDIGILLMEIVASIAIGYWVLGNIMKLILALKIHSLSKTFFILLFGFLVYVFSHFVRDWTAATWDYAIHLEPLLICILGSFYVTNYSGYRAEFLKILEEAGLPVYVAFFTFTGATLAVNVLGSVIGVALILFVVRIVTMIMGGYVGGFLAKDPMKVNHLSWMPYVTQAGVALGLATIVADEFPGWGDEFATVIIAVIVINQFVGPPLFKWAIHRIGEDRSKFSKSDFMGQRCAIIFGFENQSLALARTLIENGWKVKIATKLDPGSIDAPDDVEIIYEIRNFNKEEFDNLKVDAAEAIIAMLSDEENLMICETAYQYFGTRDMIVRLNHRENYNKFLQLDARVVDPKTAIVSLLDHFVRSPQATSLLLGMEKGQDSRDIEVLNPDMHGIPLRELRLPSDVIILSIVRGGQTIISHGYTRLRIKDIVTVVGSVKSLDQVQFKFDE